MTTSPKGFTWMYIDCEWNSYNADPNINSEMISIALVTPGGHAFYAQFDEINHARVDPWVYNNVIPHLDDNFSSYKQIQIDMSRFLSQFSNVHIVADWPEDIERFCRLCVTGPGERIPLPAISFEIVTIDADSELPHHALHDAKGLMKAHISRYDREG